MNRKDIRLVNRRAKELARQFQSLQSNDDYHDMIASGVRNVRLTVPHRSFRQWLALSANWITLIFLYVTCPIWSPFTFLILVTKQLYQDWGREETRDTYIHGNRFWWE